MLKFHNSDLWIAWLVFFCLNVCVRALEVTVSQSSVQVARGQAAVLPCTFTTSAALNNLYIIWMVTPLANANQPEQVIIYQGGQVFSLANHMNGRVGFVSTMPSTSASIFINNTQLSDTGTYQCLVNNLPDRGGRNIGVIGLTVLVPPSIPSCRIQGSLDVGSDVMLLCGSDEGIPTPTYAWEKLESVPKLPHNAMQGTKPLPVGIPFCPTFSGKCAALDSRCGVTSARPGPPEDDLPPKRSSSVKAFQADASSSENDTLTSTNTYNSRYWHNPKPNYDTNSYTRYNGDTRQTFTGGSTAPSRPAYANGSHTLPPPKTLVVTTNSAPSPPVMARSNGSLSLRPTVATTPAVTHGQQHTHSYAVSQATLERMGAVPVMVPAQSRAGSLV
ncbi:immunoglobulin superfamily member 11 [Garra rufa]|uniref:immunoglobulin superfamily member 11 n=1 Tax=Garra rufa TaxID=137080 RepID=UPI003CCEC91F